MTDREQYLKDHLHTWLESAISALEKQVDEKERVSILSPAAEPVLVTVVSLQTRRR
ncbi:hypothetical protein MUP05_00670 [Candidatus Bathyarchaeota archaeon]|jgi:hypothetical protein|nr:hypothetical protein [Candidatus Bathyarchaeota archaeon]